MKIVHKNGSFYVKLSSVGYEVWRTGPPDTHDSTYTEDTDGLSIALARCNYLAKRLALVQSSKDMVCVGCGLGQKGKGADHCIECGGRLVTNI